LISGGVNVPIEFEAIQAVDLVDWERTSRHVGFEKLVRTIREIVNQDRSQQLELELQDHIHYLDSFSQNYNDNIQYTDEIWNNFRTNINKFEDHIFEML